MKNLKSYLGLAVGICCSLGFATNVSATVEVADNTALGIDPSRTGEIVFANGHEIIIEAKTDGSEGAIINWTDENNQVQAPIEVSKDAIIFGGSHNGNVAGTNIIMNGGQVAQIYGGGLHTSHVGNAKITINNGKVDFVMGGGAGLLARTNCPGENSAKPADKFGARNIVDSTEITINNGTFGLVYAGGEQYAYTKKAKVTINNGSFEGITASGSNGYTDTTDLFIKGGNIDFVQSVNRGELINSNITISGNAQINNLFVTTETAEDTTGVVESVKVEVIEETAKVNNLLAGKVIEDTYVEISFITGTVTNMDEEIQDIVSADYTQIFDLFAQIELLDESLYTEESVKAVVDAINAIDMNLKAKDQATVDQMAENLRVAISKLELIKKNDIVDQISNQKPVTNPNNEITKNPNTVDEIISYITLSLFSLSGLAISTKKVLFR